MREVLACLLTLVIFGALGFTHVQQPDGPDDEAAYERFQSEQLFQANCLICHTEEMTRTQRLTPAQWKSVVEKMIGWGAPVPPEDTARLIAFLAQEYPVEKPRPEPVPVASAPLLSTAGQTGSMDHIGTAAQAEGGHALYTQFCANCHGGDARGADLGPNLVEKPVLVQPGAWGEVLRSGRRRMPGFAAVLKPEQERAILVWIAGLHN